MRLVVYSTIYKVWCIPGGCLGFCQQEIPPSIREEPDLPGLVNEEHNTTFGILHFLQDCLRGELTYGQDLFFTCQNSPVKPKVIWSGILQQKQQGADLSHSFHGNPMGMRTVLVWQPDSLTMSHLETLLKFSTILGATDQRTHIQGNDTAILDGYPVTHNQDAHPAKWVGRLFWDDREKGAFEHIFWRRNFRTNQPHLQGFRNILGDDPLGQALHDGCLAHTRISNLRGTGDWRWFEIIRAALGLQVLLRVLETQEKSIKLKYKYGLKKNSYQPLDTRFYPPSIHFCNVIHFTWLLDTIFPFLQPSTANHQTEAPGWDYSSFFGPKPWIPMRVLEGGLVGEILGSL